jgi:hypothetical protein
MISDGVHFRPMVEKVLADPFWSLDHRRRGLTFITSPISLSYFRASQAITNTANLGRYSVSIGFYGTKLTARVFEFADNLWVERYIHPHVDTEGSICFGNAKPAASVAAASIDLPSFMSIIKDVLTIYNDDNPYRNLYQWDSSNSDYCATNDPNAEEEPEEDYDRDEEYDENN